MAFQTVRDHALQSLFCYTVLVYKPDFKASLAKAGEEHLKPICWRRVANPVKEDTGKSKAGERRRNLSPLLLSIDGVLGAAEEEVLIIAYKAIPEPQLTITALQGG
jgi:hypothetical protein